MRTLLASVTEQAIKNAPAVFLVDPRISKYSLQLFGQNTGALTSQHEARQVPIPLDIEIDSTDENQIQHALRLVEAAKGHLPPNVQSLKK